MVVGKEEHHSAGASRVTATGAESSSSSSSSTSSTSDHPRDDGRGTNNVAALEGGSESKNAVRWDAAEAGTFLEEQAEVSSSGNIMQHEELSRTRSIKLNNVEASKNPQIVGPAGEVARSEDGAGKAGKRTKNKRLRRAARAHKDNRRENLRLEEQEHQRSTSIDTLDKVDVDAGTLMLGTRNATSLQDSRLRRIVGDMKKSRGPKSGLARNRIRNDGSFFLLPRSGLLIPPEMLKFSYQNNADVQDYAKNRKPQEYQLYDVIESGQSTSTATDTPSKSNHCSRSTNGGYSYLEIAHCSKSIGRIFISLVIHCWFDFFLQFLHTYSTLF